MIAFLPSALSDPQLRGTSGAELDQATWGRNERRDTTFANELNVHEPSNVAAPLHRTTDAEKPSTAALRSSTPTEVEAGRQRITMIARITNMIKGRIVLIVLVVNALIMITLTVYMFQGSSGSARQPPSWSLDMEHRVESSYSFKHWTRDLMLWTVANSDI